MLATTARSPGVAAYEAWFSELGWKRERLSALHSRAPEGVVSDDECSLRIPGDERVGAREVGIDRRRGAIREEVSNALVAFDPRLALGAHTDERLAPVEWLATRLRRLHLGDAGFAIGEGGWAAPHQDHSHPPSCAPNAGKHASRLMSLNAMSPQRVNSVS